jgi:ligand-binding sensor domain-containing protein
VGLPSSSSLRRKENEARPGVQQRLLATYLDGIEDWGQATAAFMPLDYDDVLVPEARALVRWCAACNATALPLPTTARSCSGRAPRS